MTVTVESGPFEAHKGKGLKVCHSTIKLESESVPSTRVTDKQFKEKKYRGCHTIWVLNTC